MSRPTDDPKEYVIKVRVNEETKRKIESLAKEQEVTMSEIIRKAISKSI